MKHFLQLTTILLLALNIFSCSNNPPSNTHIKGTIKGLSKGTVYLKKVEDTALVVIDSVNLKGSDSFIFNLNIKEPDVYYLHLDKKDGVEFNDLIEVFLEPSEVINITTQLENFNNKIVVTGSQNHSKFEAFKNINSSFNKQRFSLLRESLKATRKSNQDSINLLNVQIEKTIKHKYLYTVNFALTNKEYEVAPYVVLREIKDANIKYLDTVYKSLGKQIKVSKYGKQLKDLIAERKLSDK